MIAIRKMSDGDIEQVYMLEKRVFSMPWNRQDFVEILSNHDALYLVAEEDTRPGTIIAYCGMRNVVGEAYISNVAVHPDYRKRGVARQMLTQLLEHGKVELGAEAYTLEVRKNNIDALKLYEYLGFVQEGIRKNFYEKPVEDAIIMWKR